MANNIENLIDEIDTLSISISNLDEVQDILTRDDIIGDLENKDLISKQIIDQKLFNTNTAFIRIYGNNGNIKYSTNNIGTKIEMEKMRERIFTDKNTGTEWMWERGISSIERVYSRINKVNRKIPLETKTKIMSGNVQQDSSHYYDLIGYTEIGLKENAMLRMYSVFYWGSSTICVVDAYGEIISHIDKLQIGKHINIDWVINKDDLKTSRINKENFEILIPLENSSEWSLYLNIPMNELKQYSEQILILNLYILMSILIAVVIFSYFESLIIIKPLYNLNKMMGKANLENLDTEINYSINGNEIDMVIFNYNKMMSRLRQLIREINEAKVTHAELEKRKKEMELIAFQSQINPHFMYNTFSTISFLISMGRNDEASNMLEVLGKLFKTGIYRGTPLVLLQEEIEHLNKYIQLQKMRFGDKITVEFDIEEKLYTSFILKLTLQPIIENSIYHGIEMMDGNGIITVKGSISDNIITFKITDNGEGIEMKKLENIQLKLSQRIVDRGIGLQNVNERIKLHFGQEYGVNISSIEGVGTKIMIKIPYIMKRNTQCIE